MNVCHFFGISMNGILIEKLGSRVSCIEGYKIVDIWMSRFI